MTGIHRSDAPMASVLFPVTGYRRSIYSTSKVGSLVRLMNEFVEDRYTKTSVIEHCCIHSVDSIRWENFLSTSEAGFKLMNIKSL